MRKKGNAVSLIFIFVVLVGLLIFLGSFGQRMLKDSGVIVASNASARGINIITVANVQNSTHVRAITNSVINASKKGGNGPTIVIMCGVLADRKGNTDHTAAIIEGLLNSKFIDGVGVYSTDDDDCYREVKSACKDAGAIWLASRDIVIDLNKEGEDNSKMVEASYEAGLYTLPSNAVRGDDTMLITAIGEHTDRTRGEIEQNGAGVKIVVSESERSLICNMLIVLDNDDSQAGIFGMNTDAGGVQLSSSSYTLESGNGHMTLYCGRSDLSDKLFDMTRHSIGVIEIAADKLPEESSRHVDHAESDDKEDDDEEDED